ncbi:sugar ABC transporter permease [Lachnoclostridium sp. An169]|nr:sugar ABC transporter permease [Lachnoclostridium sp. An169]
MSKQGKIMQICSHIILAAMSVMAVVPFWLLIAASFSDTNYAVAEGYQFFPEVLSLDAYEYILRQWAQIGRAYLVTIVVTVAGTAASLIIVSMLAYGLAQEKLPGGKVIFALILITMLFNGGIVPQYMIYNNFFHLKNTIFGLIIPNLLLNGFTVVLVRNYFRSSIPGELSEAMRIDGAGTFYIYRHLILPLSKPILATIGLMEAVSYWNDWNNGLYYITDSNLYSMQQLLNEINNNVNFLANNSSMLGGVDPGALPTATMRLAIAVIAILPVLAVYPFFQKYFAKGITMGAVKG